MAVFRYPIDIAATPDGPFERLEAVVDTGSTYLWVPRSILERLGISSLETGDFETATGERVVREIGQVALRLEGRTRFVDCVFGDEGTASLLGAVTLDQFRLAVDPIGKRLIPVPGYLLAATAMAIREAIDAIVTQLTLAIYRYYDSSTMKKMLIYLPEELHEGLREIAFRRRTTMSDLIRRAIEKVYMDELDTIDMERELEEYARDPSSAMSWEEFKASLRRGVQA